MRCTKITFLFAFLLILLMGSACSDNKNATANFQFNLQKGKAYEYEMDFDIKQELSGQNIATNMKSDYVMEVIGDDGNVKTLKTTYERFAMNVEMPDRTISADSDSKDTSSMGDIADPSQLMTAMFGALKGKSFIIKVDKEGKVTEVTGLNEIADAMVNSLRVKEEMKPMVRQAFTQQFNEQNIKEIFSQSFNIFPNKPVQVGDSWEKKMAGTTAMPMDVTTTYTVKSIEGNMVNLDAKSKMNFTGGGNMSGEQTGTMKVDAKTGLVVDAEFNQKMEGQMQMTTKGRITGKERS
ncbi:MAG TPA: DUF6263 family protein [Flavisolibacter sp.]|nr:DUF6263 family protein [Flavisolibacter sp.]